MSKAKFLMARCVDRETTNNSTYKSATAFTNVSCKNNFNRPSVYYLKKAQKVRKKNERMCVKASHGRESNRSQRIEFQLRKRNHNIFSDVL